MDFSTVKMTRSPDDSVCLAIALTRSELPTEMTGRPSLGRRLHLRGDRPEYRFYYRDRNPRIPVVRDGKLILARWGNGRGQSLVLPRTGWTWRRTVEEGGWASLEPVPVTIPATYGLERRGVWYLIQAGIRGLLVPDERGNTVCYMICEPASHYYSVMTGATRMPVLINQRI